MMPNGNPSTNPAGTARDAMSSRLAKFVYRPIRLFAPIGSAATSASVGCHVVVGVRSAVLPSREARPAAPRASSRSWSAKSSAAVGVAPASTIAATLGSRSAPISSRWASMWAPTAAYRSATNAPP